jgi:hypothetical protein
MEITSFLLAVVAVIAFYRACARATAIALVGVWVH